MSYPRKERANTGAAIIFLWVALFLMPVLLKNTDITFLNYVHTASILVGIFGIPVAIAFGLEAREAGLKIKGTLVVSFGYIIVLFIAFFLLLPNII